MMRDIGSLLQPRRRPLMYLFSSSSDMAYMQSPRSNITSILSSTPFEENSARNSLQMSCLNEACGVAQDGRTIHADNSISNISYANKNFYCDRLIVASSHKTRILKIEPGAFDDPISVTLITVHNLPHYNALSYTWGDASQTEPITVNGRPGFVVIANLYAALRHLRKRCYRTQSEREIDNLWTDAISINQADEVERNCQVQSMSLIFQNAATVYIWLGPCGALANHLSESEHCSYMLEKSEHLESDSGYHDRGGQPLIHCNEDPKKNWQMKIWTVQEAVVARDIKALFGPHRRTWHALIKSINGQDSPMSPLWSDEDHKVLPFKFGPVNEFRESQPLLSSTKHALSPENGAWAKSLMNCLCFTAICAASDPRDKVYGILGVANAQTILPDYGLTYEEVCKRTTLCIIEQERTLDVLFWVLPQFQKSGPSWAIDFEKGLMKPPISILTGCRSKFRRRTNDTNGNAALVHDKFTTAKAYRAAKDRREPRFRKNGEKLEVRGIKFDSILRIYEHGDVETINTTAVLKRFENDAASIKQHHQGARAAIFALQDSRTVFERAVTGDGYLSRNKISPAKMAANMEDFVTHTASGSFKIDAALTLHRRRSFINAPRLPWNCRRSSSSFRYRCHSVRRNHSSYSAAGTRNSPFQIDRGVFHIRYHVRTTHGSFG